MKLAGSIAVSAWPNRPPCLQWNTCILCRKNGDELFIYSVPGAWTVSSAVQLYTQQYSNGALLSWRRAKRLSLIDDVLSMYTAADACNTSVLGTTDVVCILL